jgi:putative tricarboxylic transport membrane protein
MLISPPPATEPTPHHAPVDHTAGQTAVGLATLAVAGLLMWGASHIPGDAGYAGVGPNFLPWLVSGVLVVCGLLLLWQARHGGFQHMAEPSGAARGDWPALAWVVGGVVANAALINHLGFILSCSLCFALAVRGLRLAEGQTGGGLQRVLSDLLIGLAIAAPVFWLFTQLLAVNLPALTTTGWL